MSKKIIIFITTFIITGIIILGVYLWINKDKTTSTTGETPWYQSFNPFGSGSIIENPNIKPDPNNPIIDPSNLDGGTSRFYQITDFAIAGATFLEDIRPIEGSTESEMAQPKEIKTIISAETKDGRKEIQKILNTELSLAKPLVVDGVFGKMATEAIKKFQQLKNLTVTGKIDEETASYFTKTTLLTPEKETTEAAPSVRYVEKKNGHIYKMFLDTKSKEKISNSTIPGIHEAFFDKTGNSVIYRYLSSDNVISSFMATIGAPKGEFLPQNISDLSTSTNKDKFFYLTKNNEGSTGTISFFDLLKRRDPVFGSPYTEWLSQWDNNQNIYLTTKASGFAEGNIFKLNATNKTLTKVFGNILGLTTLVSPDGTFVLYSTSSTKGPLLGVFDINKHTTRDLGLVGLPEKCVWEAKSVNIYCSLPNALTGGQYPDVWYQGIISFDDYFIKINTITGDKTTIANSLNETPVDAISLFLDKNENNLFFINKKDSTFWSLNIK